MRLVVPRIDGAAQANGRRPQVVCLNLDIYGCPVVHDSRAMLTSWYRDRHQTSTVVPGRVAICRR